MKPHRQVPLPALGIALGLSLLLAGCSQPGQDSAKTAAKDQPSTGAVRYVKVVLQTVPETLDLAAKVQQIGRAHV